MTDRKQNHKFEPIGSSFDDSLVCKRCGKHPSKHRLYPTMGFIDADPKTEVVIKYLKSNKPWDYKVSLKKWLNKDIEFSKIGYANFSDLMVLGVVEFDKDHCIYVLLPENVFKK